MTIRDQFNHLPAPYNELAIQNTKGGLIDCRASSLCHALARAFYWETTPEGFNFWRDVHDWAQYNLNNKPFELPPIPNTNTP